ncbi:hypothetical protein O181_108889 [Austropuccinia psidii MF-1]|uniref:Uncharacterized protein n=1 Tax=Austropuccinia psidii MF-1 TaxID=1389203 RepID=A0A9Q3JVL8_9BASI|nr:hypothetical protein [Austropuccinia psidii MF-1]
MPIQHSPAARQTRSQARPPAALTQTPRAPLDGTPTVPQLRAKLDRGPILEGEAPSRKEGRGPRRSSSFSEVLGKMSEPSLLAIMQKMTQIMANLQEASSSKASRLHL